MYSQTDFPLFDPGPWIGPVESLQTIKVASKPYRVLVLSRSYPNNILPQLGLWVKRLLHHCSDACELKVISPVPYFPPVKGFERYGRFRKIVRHSSEDGVEVFHPRFFVGPGISLYNTEALSYYMGIRSTADKLHKDSNFDLIHANFIYPDGVAAALLGRRYKIPVIVTEHAPWRPNWIDKYRLVRRQALWAARECKFLVAVSRSVKDTIVHFTGEPEKVRVIPIGVDGSVFTMDQGTGKVNKNQILYVGFMNFNKGIDILLKAFSRVLVGKPDAKLVMVGGSFYTNTMKQEARLRMIAKELGLERHMEFAGIKSPAEVARYMRESALLVLPSRAESFGAVLVEALACGTPVVAARCGGPEDIISDEVGILVPKEDDNVLASAIERILEQRHNYDPVRLRKYGLERFGWSVVAQRNINLYKETLGRT